MQSLHCKHVKLWSKNIWSEWTIYGINDWLIDYYYFQYSLLLLFGLFNIISTSQRNYVNIFYLTAKCNVLCIVEKIGKRKILTFFIILFFFFFIFVSFLGVEKCFDEGRFFVTLSILKLWRTSDFELQWPIQSNNNILNLTIPLLLRIYEILFFA